jgi:hypothetical protein
LPTATAAASASAAPAAAGQIPRYNHIVVIMFTDHGFANIPHNKYAPTFNRRNQLTSPSGSGWL